MRQGYFELDPNSGDRPVYRLRWHPEDPLTEQERGRARFIRYLIEAGHLSERAEANEQ